MKRVLFTLLLLASAFAAVDITLDQAFVYFVDGFGYVGGSPIYIGLGAMLVMAYIAYAYRLSAVTIFAGVPLILALAARYHFIDNVVVVAALLLAGGAAGIAIKRAVGE